MGSSVSVSPGRGTKEESLRIESRWRHPPGKAGTGRASRQARRLARECGGGRAARAVIGRTGRRRRDAGKGGRGCSSQTNAR